MIVEVISRVYMICFDRYLIGFDISYERRGKILDTIRFLPFYA